MLTEKLLRTDDLWSGTPAYRSYDLGLALRRLESIDRALLREGGFPPHQAALDRTARFVRRAFDLYEGRVDPPYPADRVFIVPSRMADGDRLHAAEWSEAMPLLHPRYGLDAWAIRRLLCQLPPCVPSSYRPAHGRQGHVVLVPVNGGTAADLGAQRAADTARAVVGDAARFARHRLGAEVAGLGATLPSLTAFGGSIDVPGLTVTTGHGGTVHLLRCLVREIAATVLDPAVPLTVGVIGAAGSIGTSILVSLQREFPDLPFVACERESRLGRVQRILAREGSEGRTRTTADVSQVFARCRLIVAAATEKLDLGRLPDTTDLTGTVLVDDSQPYCVDRDQWERRGGILLWPVGRDAVPGGPLHRQGGFRYGPGAGLLHADDVWGCEAEAAAIAITGELDAALRGPVTPEAARRIGDLCTAIGVRTAPLQSFGRPVRTAP